jgi:hypothetical protein
MSVPKGTKLLYQHARIITETTTANWNSGVASSGNPGGDLFTLGAVGQWWRLQEAYLLLSAFNAAATVTIRAYEPLMGAERMVATDDWTVALDGPVIFLFFWVFAWEIYGPVRIEIFSDQAADDGLAAPYECRVKEW